MESKALEHIANKTNIEKSKLERIDVSQLPKELPEFKKSTVTKDILISKWLGNWIKSNIGTGKLKPQQLLPKKEDIASYLGISTGTIQNAIRYIEDAGLVESKQRIGTMLKSHADTDGILRKQTSKRDGAVSAIKKMIIDDNYKIGQNLPSSREISKIIGSAPNTTRLALEFLASTGIIEALGNRGNKANWTILNIPKLNNEIKNVDIKTVTLVDKATEDLKNYIQENYVVGDKLPPHLELSSVLKVSIKTTHDAMKKLVKAGILTAKRGRYGTTIRKMPNDIKSRKIENDVFDESENAIFYNYEKIERHLKEMIINNYSIGDKLPSMSELAKQLDVSGNTIRKALQNLGKECLVEFSRGKYGGTFVVNMPKLENDKKKFTWLSVNKDAVSNYRKILETTK